MAKPFLFLVPTLLLLPIQSELQAQKFGYVNSTELMEEMPEMQQLQASMTALRTQLEKKGQGMMDYYQKEYKYIVENGGDLTPNEIKKRRDELKEMEVQMEKYQKESQEKIADKQNQLLQPIIDKISNAITEIGKEEDFELVFDSSTGIILYGKQGINITEKVKERLGI